MKSYDSIEEMFNDIRKMVEKGREEAKHHHIKVEHLKQEGYFAYMHYSGIPIFGEVIESTEHEEDEKDIAAARENGFIFGRCYSVACPEGELGNTHVTRITHKISKSEFEVAKVNGWRHLQKTN